MDIVKKIYEYEKAKDSAKRSLFAFKIYLDFVYEKLDSENRCEFDHAYLASIYLDKRLTILTKDFQTIKDNLVDAGILKRNQNDIRKNFEIEQTMERFRSEYEVLVNQKLKHVYGCPSGDITHLLGDLGYSEVASILADENKLIPDDEC